MEEIYGINHSPSTTADHEYADKLALIMTPENDLMMMSDHPVDDHEFHYYHHYDQYSMIHHQHNWSTISPVFGSEDFVFHSGSAAASINDVHHHHQNSNSNNQRDHDQHGLAASSHHAIIKAKIASHPSYPKLLDAYIDCQKVGAPPEIVSLLDEIRREKDLSKLQQQEEQDAAAVSMCNSNGSLGLDPELDEFMETYCDILVKYKTDLSRPFDEATSFINSIETQLGNLCNDEGGLSSDDELSGGEIEIQDAQTTKSEDRELKDRLLRRYGGHISSLKIEFSKKKKKGKLPKEAKQILFDWWNSHHKWPYPTEADKISLAESTGLDQKQINNWFINHRKRHWKSSESMQLAMMNNLSAHNFFTAD